jgi:hypothetical protein
MPEGEHDRNIPSLEDDIRAEQDRVLDVYHDLLQARQQDPENPDILTRIEEQRRALIDLTQRLADARSAAPHIEKELHNAKERSAIAHEEGVYEAVDEAREARARRGGQPPEDPNHNINALLAGALRDTSARGDSEPRIVDQSSVEWVKGDIREMRETIEAIAGSIEMLATEIPEPHCGRIRTQEFELLSQTTKLLNTPPTEDPAILESIKQQLGEIMDSLVALNEEAHTFLG